MPINSSAEVQSLRHSVSVHPSKVLRLSIKTVRHVEMYLSVILTRRGRTRTRTTDAAKRQRDGREGKVVDGLNHCRCGSKRAWIDGATSVIAVVVHLVVTTLRRRRADCSRPPTAFGSAWQEFGPNSAAAFLLSRFAARRSTFHAVIVDETDRRWPRWQRRAVGVIGSEGENTRPGCDWRARRQLGGRNRIIGPINRRVADFRFRSSKESSITRARR